MIHEWRLVDSFSYDSYIYIYHSGLLGGWKLVDDGFLDL